jgi:hypothetical protein
MRYLEGYNHNIWCSWFLAATRPFPVLLNLESSYMNKVQRLKIVGGEICFPDDIGSAELAFFLEDRGGRRLGFRKREFSYDAHIPERRSGAERRSGTDRREMVPSQMVAKDRRGIEEGLDS